MQRITIVFSSKMQSVIYDCIDELKLAQVYTHSLEFLNVYEGFIQWVVIIQCQTEFEKKLCFHTEYREYQTEKQLRSH